MKVKWHDNDLFREHTQSRYVKSQLHKTFIQKQANMNIEELLALSVSLCCSRLLICKQVKCWGTTFTPSLYNDDKVYNPKETLYFQGHKHESLKEKCTKMLYGTNS
jgi:hypothetical protein